MSACNDRVDTGYVDSTKYSAEATIIATESSETADSFPDLV